MIGRRGLAGVNSQVVVHARPPFNVFDGLRGRRPGSRAQPMDARGQRTGAALEGDLRGFGINVPVPTTHAGRLANKTAARLMWARKPIRLRWVSPTGQEPFAWRIYAAPSARQNVLDVLRDVVSEVGQGTVQIQVQHDTRPGIMADEAWYVELLPPQLVPPPEGDRPLTGGNAPGPARYRTSAPAPAAPADDGAEMGGPSWQGYAPKRWSSYGPRAWRTNGAPVAGGYADGALQEPEPTGPARASNSLEQQALQTIVATLRTKGEAAGLERAAKVGPRYVAAARAWIAARASPEDTLASEIAAYRARIARHRQQHPNGCETCIVDRLVIAILEIRLDEVREAKRKGETPSQAVADKPEVVVVRVPRWVSYSVAFLAVLGLVRSFAPPRRA